MFSLEKKTFRGGMLPFWHVFTFQTGFKDHHEHLSETLSYFCLEHTADLIVNVLLEVCRTGPTLYIFLPFTMLVDPGTKTEQLKTKTLYSQTKTHFFELEENDMYACMYVCMYVCMYIYVIDAVIISESK